MDTLLPFAVCLVLITLASVRYHLPPFLTLTGAAVLFGVLSGMPVDVFMPAVTAGAGRIFAILGIVIFAGVVIAQVLRESGRIEDIVADIRKVARHPLYTAGIAGYLLSVPLMCGITSFVILAPIVSHLRSERAAATTLLFVTGVAGIISYVLLYPSPVIHTVVTTLGLYPGEPWRVDLFTLPISLLLLSALLLFWRSRIPAGEAPEQRSGGGIAVRTWLPLIVLFLMLGIGFIVPPLRGLSNIYIALLAALFVALIDVPADVRERALARGTKNAGIIIFDLTGAGAFGGVIAASTFPSDVAALVAGHLPGLLLPFVIAALLQAAQGSRVVTAAVTATVLSTTGLVPELHPAALVLMIAAGAFMFSYVSDPFFWLLKRTTGEGFETVVRRYTLPLSIAGVVTLAAALLVEAALG
ncbi:hypothetical protein ABH15_07975 [Methanoculleus taiwanensis]|uniref:Gluconate permease n=1 Tax=Methanoculleus taiwanensis TaxID=1550565 RepID=A0A498H171_9EURY|nr:GntP family permease [Methanoculleus taiwanensis]RXE56107.1 hypothetical protein ABH15_07975 [Methanoculleus taiwanensis]